MYLPVDNLNKLIQFLRSVVGKPLAMNPGVPSLIPSSPSLSDETLSCSFKPKPLSPQVLPNKTTRLSTGYCQETVTKSLIQFL